MGEREREREKEMGPPLRLSTSRALHLPSPRSQASSSSSSSWAKVLSTTQSALRGGADASRRESRWVASSPLRTFGRRRDFAGIARSVATTTTISRSDIITADPKNNVTDNIFQKLGVNLHHRKDHPLGIIKGAIFQYFEDLYPVVTTKQNFDELLIPADHISRSDNDTYYVNSETVLRCHTSAHQAELLREKH